MTQIWPGLAVAPVPILVSVICRPEAVVTGFPTSCAEADVDAPAAKAAVRAVTRASAARVNAGMGILLMCGFLVALVGQHRQRVELDALVVQLLGILRRRLAVDRA